MQSNVWRKQTALFLSSQTISLLGSSLVQYAMMWHVTLKTQSGMMMTLYTVCGFLPAFFLSPFAGVWADRYDRRKLMMLSDGLIALATLILAMVYMTGTDALWLLFLTAGIRSLGSAVQQPAVGAFLPQFVPEEHLMRVNGINGTIQSVLMFVSPMISGILINYWSLGNIFLIDVVTAAIAISILLLFLRIPAHARAGTGHGISYFTDLKQGFSYIGSHRFILRFFIFFGVFSFFITPAAFLTPLQVTRSFGPDVWRLTAIEIAFSVGMMAGGLMIAGWGGFKNRVHTLSAAFIAIGLWTVALGLVPAFYVYLFFMVLTGVCIPLFNTPATVMVQETVESDYLGRVFGVMGMISSSMMPVAMLFFGPLADRVRIESILLVTGVIVVLTGIRLRFDKPLVLAGKPQTPEST